MLPNEQAAVEAMIVEKQFHTMGDYELSKEATGEDFVKLLRLIQSFGVEVPQ